MDGPRPRLPNPRSHLAAVTLLACAVAVGGWYGVRTYTAQVNAQGGFCCMQAGQACAASTLGWCVAAGHPWARTRDACDYELCNVRGWCCDPDAANNCPANADTTRAGCGAGKTFFTDRAACQTAAALPAADRCESLGYCCSPLNINNPGQNCKEPLVESTDCGGGATWYASKATCDLMNNPADVRNFCNDTEGICCYPRGTTDDTFGGALAEAVCWGDEPGEGDLNRRSDCLRLGGTWAGQVNAANADGCVDQLLPQNCGSPRNYCVYHKNEAGALVVGCKNAGFDGFNPPFNPPPAANAAATEGQRLRGTANAGYATADACTAACRIPVVAEAACCDPTKPQGQRCAATGVFGNNPCMQCQTKGDAAGCNAVAGGVCAWRDGFCEADVAKCSTFCCDANARQCRRVPAGTAGCADLGTPYVGDPKPQNDCQNACGGVAQQAACPQGQRQLVSMALCNAQCGVQIGGGQNGGQQGGQLGGRQAGGIGSGRQGGQGQVAGRQGGQGGVGQLSGNTQGNIGTLAGVNGATSSAGTSAGGTSSLASSRAPSTTSRTSSTSSRTSSTSPRASLTSSRTSATTSRTSSTSSRTSSTTSRTSSTTSRTTSAGGGTGGTTSRTSSGGGGGIGRTTSVGGRTSSTTSRTSSTTSRTSSTTSRTTSRTTSTTSRTTSRTSSTTSRTSSTTSRTSATTSRTSATTSRTSSTTSRTSSTTSRTSATTSRTSATTSRISSTTSRTTSATTSRTSATTSRTSATTSRTSATTSRSSTSATTSRTSATTSRTSTSATTSRTSATTSRTSATTSRTSANTSRTSTSVTTSRTSTSATTSRPTTSRSVPLDMCTGTECVDFGDAFCGNLGLACQPTDSLPCFACTGGSSMSSRTSAATSAGTTSRATSTSRTISTTSSTTSRPTTSRTSATTSRTTSAPGTTSRTASSRTTTSRTSSSRTASRTSLRMSSAPVPRCGNDIREPGEQCGEPGLSCLSGQYCEPTTCRCNQSSSTTSRTSTSSSASRSTSSVPRCGNGTREPGEQCGEPGLRCPAGSRCDTPVCLCDLDVPRPFCRDGRVNPGEQCGEPGLRCPAGQDCDPSACLCSGGAACGDGLADDGEQCNEPGLFCGAGAHCEKRSCLCMPFIDRGRCGDGVLQGHEECDDGNARAFDGCSAFCEYERGVCGDGVLQRSLGEQCEPALHDPLLPFRCTDDCRIQTDFCGNGIQDPGEECDDGVNNSNIQNVRCRLDCSLARCGDGILDSMSEQCDDGNRLWGDGCDRFCEREVDVAGADARWANGIALPASLVELPFLGVRGASRLAVIPGVVDLMTPATHPGQTPQTGPGVVAIAAAGAAAGVAWMRRRRP